MNPKWAEENLQTIRTLMERSAIYRRALAPIMVYVGVVGIIGGGIGLKLKINSDLGFVEFWSAVAAVALGGALFLVRRQALKDSEPFWSPPTKRVANALIPSFSVGGFITALVISANGDAPDIIVLVPVWCWAFGCAIHSAGFFMTRSVKLFGWAFIITGFLLIGFIANSTGESGVILKSPHLLMGAIFGGLHLAYGIYLYFTEKKTPVA